MSHVAGVIYGFALGTLYLPSLPFEWMETLTPVLGAHLLHICVQGPPACSTKYAQMTRTRSSEGHPHASAHLGIGSSVRWYGHR